MIGWLKRLLGLQSTNHTYKARKAEDAVDTSDFSGYSLYQIGDTMCRHHDDGLPTARKATHYGEHSMQVVLNDAYGSALLEPSMVEDLDTLTENAEETSEQAREFGGIDPDKVETFRRAFFDQFGEQEKIGVLRSMYHNARESFALGRLVDETETDGYRFVYHVREDNPVAEMSMSEDPDTYDASFNEESVEMMNVGCRLSLIESNIGDQIDAMVAEEASLLWDAIVECEFVDARSTIDGEPIEAIFDSINKIKRAYGQPDTIVTGNGFEWNDTVYGCEVLTDEIGVMNKPFVVADSGSLGYRVTRSPVSVERPDSFERFVYQIHWAGNYAITGKDMVAASY